jgi:hypothetical protein
MTISDPLQIIAAFVDGERVDAQQLKRALALPEGRDYLAELVAMREVVNVDANLATPAASRSARRWLVAAAAAVVLSLGGGYALGHQTATSKSGTSLNQSSTNADVVAPPPTRVIDVASGSSYISQGGK